MKYTIHAVADENASSYDPEILASSDDATEADAIARKMSGAYAYGTAILDTATGKVDYGFGFGEPVPDPEV